ncbi:MAG: asparagine synthetase [Fibrobacteres bacterium]|nr:asparagine synthetase [Fibrobacterota bacterium]
MCGISGIFDPNRPLTEGMKSACLRMTETMAYRGPDQHGMHAAGNVVLGHRRLSIIDISSGLQPMRSAVADHTLVFNGEIYNFVELRKELQDLGYPFATRSDTEVILAGYRHWGRSVVERLRGMFAFVLHDAEKNLVFGARDGIGKKPLYLRRDGSTLYFASDLNAMAASLPGRPRLSPEAMSLYFTLGYIPAPYCVYEGISKLQAGTAFQYGGAGADGAAWEEWTYWDPLPKETSVTDEECLERLRGLLDGAVERRLVSEVPLGAFLSGGIDSNLVVSTMARLGKEGIKTFTAGFGEKVKLTGVRDERELAAAAAAKYGARHHEITLSAEIGDLLPGLMPFLGEPLADASIIPTYLVCREARKSVTVSLTGDGGDEPFGGYSFRYLPHLAEQRLRGKIPAPVLGPVASALAALWPSGGGLPRYLRLKSIFRNLAVLPERAFFMDQAQLKGDEKVLGAALRPHSELASDLMAALYGKTRGADDLSRILYTDIRMYMCEDVLVKADRMSMANSLELRSPLLDQDLVSYAGTLPSRMKIRDGECKYMLSRLASERAAPGILGQPKTGFSFPLDRYFRDAWRTEFERRAFGAGSPLSDFLDPERVRDMWDGFLKGSNAHLQFLWSVHVFLVWYESFHLAIRPAPETALAGKA